MILAAAAGLQCPGRHRRLKSKEPLRRKQAGEPPLKPTKGFDGKTRGQGWSASGLVVPPPPLKQNKGFNQKTRGREWFTNGLVVPPSPKKA